MEPKDEDKPLTGAVTFVLHPTFVPDTMDAVASSSRASAEILLAESFTVGARCDGGATLLELDLKDVPGFPEAFK